MLIEKDSFTDFLVYEVDLDGNVIHVKSLDKPESSPKKKGAKDTAEGEGESEAQSTPVADAPSADAPNPEEAKPDAETEEPVPDEGEPWPERFTTTLKQFLSEGVVTRVKELYLEGPEPPFVSDSGWGGRQVKTADGTEGSSTGTATPQPEPEKAERGKGGDRGRGRGRRGGRGRERGQPARVDNRKVLSDVCVVVFALYALSDSICPFTAYFVERDADCATPSGQRAVWRKVRDGDGYHHPSIRRRV